MKYFVLLNMLNMLRFDRKRSRVQALAVNGPELHFMSNTRKFSSGSLACSRVAKYINRFERRTRNVVRNRKRFGEV